MFQSLRNVVLLLLLEAGRGLLMKPLAVDLFCGLGGWTDGLLFEGWQVIGFDIERHVYGEHRYPAQLVLQDVLMIHGSQFRNAALIVASPPCQEFSWMAMPWSRAKRVAAALRGDGEFPEGYRGSRTVADLTALFDACFRIQREACEAAGRHIPMVVENVRGAIPWVGRSRWNFGSFHIWGDVPALMPITTPRQVMKQGIAHRPDGATNFHGQKNPGFRFDGSGRSFQSESVDRHLKGIPHRPTGHWTNPEENGIKQGGDRFNDTEPSIPRTTWSKSNARKAASAMIARIPAVLARHIARYYKPQNV